MKQFLYVYIPGFEYDSKGPLHIDAIRLDATVGEILKDLEGIIKNSLKTYIYIDALDYNTGKPNKSIAGNLVYRSIKTDSNRFKDKYKGEEFLSPFYTENPGENKRALNGFFYDFISTGSGEEKTHHVIGIHNTINQCKQIKNFQSEHDGLFVVELDELNTDLNLNFTFYSRIDFSNNLIGIPENITNQDNEWFFDLDKRELSQNKFFDKYIEIGKWNTTYNPAISGNEYDLLNIETELPVPQYFDLKFWGKNNIKLWEIPVNADILVSNSNGDQLNYNFDLNSEYFRTHLDNLKKVINSYIDFYKNNSIEFFAETTLKDNLAPICNFARARDAGDSGWDARLYFSKYLYTSDSLSTNEILYQLSYVDLSNFNYLYDTIPNILIKNDTASKNLAFVTINTIGNNIIDHTGENGYIRQLVHDFYNFSLEDNHVWGTGNYSYVYDDPNNLKRKTVLTDNTSINISFSEQLPGKTELTIRLSTNFLTPNYFLFVSEGVIYNITDNKYLLEKLKTIYNTTVNRPKSTKKSGLWNDNYGFCGLYVGVINNLSELSNNPFFMSDTILGEEKRISMNLSKNNNISLKMNVSDVLFPISICEFNDSSGYRHTSDMKLEMKNYEEHNNGWNNKMEITDVDGDYFPGAWNYKTDETTKRSLTKHDDIYLVPIKYNHYQYMKDFGFGNVNFCFSQTFYIDLNSSNIKYSNLSDHEIIPMLKYENAGYMTGDTGEKLTAITVDINENLLEPQESLEPFELSKICNNVDLASSFLIKPGIFFDSTFCNDKRFIGSSDGNKEVKITFKNSVPKINIGANKAIILKILTMLPNTERLEVSYKITDSNGTRSESKKGKDGLFLFYASEESISLSFLSISFTTYSNKYELYDLLSGIGLYKIDDTNTNVVIKMLYNCLKNSGVSGFISPETDGDPYHYIIFPAVFCAKENIEFCKRNNTYTTLYYLTLWKNDYCTNKSNDPVYHYYNLSYLPEKAMYEVHGYYTIPSSNKEVSEVVLRDPTRTTNKLDIIKNKIVRL